MNKVKLGTRIPESLDLEIERVSKHLRLKKQELIVQLLSHGLLVITNLESSSGAKISNQSSPVINTLEKQSTEPKLGLLDLHSEIADLRSLVLGLQTTIAQLSNGSINSIEQKQVGNPTSTSTQAQSDCTSPPG